MMVFVVRPTNRTSVAQGLFKVCVQARERSLDTSQKCIGPRRHSYKKKPLRHKARRLEPGGRTASWGSMSAGLNAHDIDGGFPLPMSGGLAWRYEPSDHFTQTDPRIEKYGQRLTRIARLDPTHDVLSF